MTGAQAFAFGRFIAVPQRRELLADGMAVPLGPRALDILLCLLAHTRETVTKDTLLSAVWPDRVVEDNNLTVHISALRRALGDGQDGVRFVQTVPGRGYRFIAPVTVIEDDTVRRPDMDATASPLGPLVMPTNNLPQPATRFIGRAAEMAAIRGRLATHRLVTITGVGGIGKTRVALQLGTDLLPRYRDGVWLVDLAAIADPLLVVESIAAVFHLGGDAASSAERLVGFLANQELLLILDNCEHLVRRVAEVVHAILGGCARVAMLVTSRESLAVDGESLYRLPPLPFPDTTQAVDAAGALAHDAVRLFVERAAATIGSFTLDDANAPFVARICSRLDGIALAIEMAVPRLQVLNPAQLAERLNERFRLLTAHNRTVLPRHRTLRAMIDWSHELLTEAEAVLLRRLAVFAGGANLEAVIAVTVEGVPDEWNVLDLLGALIDKSLLVADVVGGEPRYRLLETTRHYALEKLAIAGEHWCRRAHAAHFAAVFERAETEWPVTPTTSWLDTYAPDTDNLRAALEWAFASDGEEALGLRLVASSYPLWWDLPQLPLHESRRWFDLAVQRISSDTPPAVSARLWFGQSWRDVRFGDRENFPAAAQAVALYRQIDDRIGLGAALWRAGSALLTAETADQAEACFIEAEQVLRGPAPTKWLALCLVKLGDLRFRQGAFDQALAAYEEALRLSRATGHWYGLMNGGSNMAELLFHLDQRDRALTQLRELNDELLRGRRTPLVATMVAHLLLAGETTEALAAAAEVITYARAIGLPSALAWTIEALGMWLAQAGELAQAARFAGYARAIHPSAATRAGSRRAVYLRLDGLLSQHLAAAERARLLSEGAGWDERQAADAAAAVCRP